VLGSLDLDATIAAIASPPGPALRGIVRLSGPRAWPIALGAFDGGAHDLQHRRAAVSRGLIRLDCLHAPLPATVELWPGPHSYTAEDVSEIHTYGSYPLMGLVLGGCLGRGARHAQPGEFTLRAFLRGRIDLTRAEAVLGVIDAGSPAQLDSALRQLAGGLSRPVLALRDRLLDRLAHLEANLDFVEEADVVVLGRDALAADLAAAAAEVEALTARLTRRDVSAGRPRVVLTGPPNAGKSRLFNALAERDQAIVSPRPGTTRDYLTAACTCEGLVVDLVDTAGVEQSDGPITAQAQALRHDQAEAADLLLLCVSHDTRLDSPSLPDPPQSILHVWTKCDLGPPGPDGPPGLIATSAATGQGLDDLRAAIAGALQERDREGVLPASTAARCRDSLARCAEALHQAKVVLAEGGGEELIAFDLRLAVDELGKVVGAVVSDDILERIFQKFCIGK
jgi:tRNA modification GTPase